MKMTIDQFKKARVEPNDYDDKHILEAQALAALLPFEYSPRVILDVDSDAPLRRFNHYNVVFTAQGLDFNFSASTYGKKHYSLFLPALHVIPNVNYNSEYKQYTAEAPNNIGTITRKKLDDWVSYWAGVYKFFSDISASRLDRKAQQLKAFEESGLSIKWDVDKSNGWRSTEVCKNGIRMRIVECDSYFSVRLDLDYKVSSSLDAFLKLSDNKYVVRD